MNQAESYHIVKNKYGSYCVPVSSDYTYTSRTIMEGRVHEPSTIKYIIDNNRNLDIIHAGAGFGDFFPALSKHCSGIIWTFEPNAENYLCAMKTIEINNIRNINLFNLGLGENTEKQYIKIKDKGLSLGPRSETTEAKDPDPGDNLQECEFTTLDEMVTGRDISIIHLDTEGYEFKILNGARRLIEKCNPKIILEIDRNALEYNEYMESIGYKPIKQLIYNARVMVFINTVYGRS